MDLRKKDLNPELKAIYDRVMNTSITQPQNGQTTQSTQATPGNGANVSQVTPTPQNQNPPSQVQNAPPSEPQSPQQAQNASPQPQNPPVQEDNAPFLSSLPPRPLNSTASKPFIFSSKNKPQESKNDKKVEKIDDSQKDASPKVRGGMMSSKIIYLLGGVFLVVYSLFWLKVFNVF